MDSRNRRKSLKTGTLSDRLAIEASLGQRTTCSLKVPTSLVSKSAVQFEEATAHHNRLADTSRHAWEMPALSSRTQHPIIVPLARKHESRRVQDFLYPEHLSQLKTSFQEAGIHRRGYLNLDEFINFFREQPEFDAKTDVEIKTFFDKIDCYSVGQIGWDDFCTYMYLELYEKDGAQTKAKEVNFVLPAETISTPHKDSICRMFHLKDGSVISCSQDGIICFWSLDWKPKRLRKSEPGLTGKPKWISDVALSFSQSKFILTTGDNEVQFYEMANFEPYCQICNLEATPLKLDFWSDPEDSNHCVMVIGDDQGCVTIFNIPYIPDAFKHWKLGPKKKGMPTYMTDKLVCGEPVAGIKVFRWKLHGSWVSEVRYLGPLRVFASCSCDSFNSLVIGNPSGSTPVESILRSFSVASGHSAIGARPYSALPAKHRLSGDQRIFRVTKGITSFDYSEKHNLLVTGGTDQLIRIWNPFVNSKPTGILEGQGSPLYCVRIDSTNGRIFSISNDNTVKVWDLIDQRCLCSVISAAHKVTSTIEAMYFNPVKHTLMLSTDQLHSLQLTLTGGLKKENLVHSHKMPITAMGYSKSFNLIITACEGSIVKVWDPSNGEGMFEFASVHGSSGVTALDLDSSGRRLVTASERGDIKIWNFNNGHCLLELDKGNSEEVTAVKFVSVNQIKYVIAVGWDRKLNFFQDMAELGVQTTQKPIQSWGSSTSQVHQDDITSVVFCPPQCLATASYDGQIVVWSMISGQLMNRLSAPILSKEKQALHQDEDVTIHKLICLEKRKSRSSAALVSSGPSGYIHFWNLYDPVLPKGVFKASQFQYVTELVSDSNNTTLISADIEGFVYWWNIQYYCVDNKSSYGMPELINKWRAHATSIRGMVLLESSAVLITASSDSSVRLWTQQGHYIGSFGQSQRWQLGQISTYQHPMAPTDVLLDPLTVPKLTVKTEVASPSLDMAAVSVEDIEINDGTSLVEDNELNEEILYKYGLSTHVPPHSYHHLKAGSPGHAKPGKRLRHFRSKSARHIVGLKPSSSSYATLNYQELNEVPKSIV